MSSFELLKIFLGKFQLITAQTCLQYLFCQIDVEISKATLMPYTKQCVKPSWYVVIFKFANFIPTKRFYILFKMQNIILLIKVSLMLNSKSLITFPVAFRRRQPNSVKLNFANLMTRPRQIHGWTAFACYILKVS